MPSDRRRRERAARFDHGQPLSKASSLPFAILFSALGLLFLSLHKPPQHALVVDLPVTNGLGRTFEPWPNDLPQHILRITASGEIWWDDAVMNRSLLVRHLKEVATARTRPGLIFAPDDDASYAVVAETLDTVSEANLAYDRFCLAKMDAHQIFSREGHEVSEKPSVSGSNFARSIALPTDPPLCGSGNALPFSPEAPNPPPA